jgi:alpha-tubulin suppressor-like RCC1 family protein
LTPVLVSNLDNAVKLAGDIDHMCALTTAQTVRCWGTNLAGGGSATPVTISLPGNAVDIGAGSQASCALLEDATLRCWGDDFLGQLGNGTILNNGSATPLRVVGIP